MDTPKLHLAMLPSPGMGHVIPLLEFAKCLVSLHGFHVSFFVLTTHASAAQSQLLRSTTVPHGLHVIHLPPADVSSLMPDDAAIETRMSIIVRESIPSIRSALAELASRPTVLIVDIFGTDTFEMAHELRMSRYVFFTSTAMLLALMIYLPTLDREVEGEYTHLREPVRIPGCKPIQIVNLVDPLQDRKIERYAWFLHQARRFPMAQGIIVNTCQVLEPKTLSALREGQIPTPRVYAVGPVVRERAPVLDPQLECLTWLDTQPLKSVLYVSFGSGGTLSVEQVNELARGLELSQQRFLWVVRSSTTSKKDGAYFTSGSGCDDLSDYLPEGFLTRTVGIGFVVPSWAPQKEILRHPSVGGFLTHCGWNSTLESIVSGVPMIAWPLYAEQKLNATSLAEDLKVAIRVAAEKGVVGREEVERVVRLVMDGADDGMDLRRRVEILRDDVLRAVGEGGSSYTSLSQVVNEWKNQTPDVL